MPFRLTRHQAVAFGVVASMVALSACGGGQTDVGVSGTTEVPQTSRSVNQGLVAVALEVDAAVLLAPNGEATAPPPDGAAIAAPSELAPASASSPSAETKPRVATSMLRGLWTAADRQAVAQFGLVTFGLPYSSPSTVQSWINEVRKLNPSIVMGGYTNAVEADATPEGNKSTYTIDTTVVANDWWLHTASGQKVQWTTAFDTYVLNLTRWGAKDASGRRFTEWLGDYVAGRIGGLKGLDYVFQDNVWYTPRPYTQYADFMRNGTNQYAMAADIQAAWRLGTTDYMTRLRSKVPGIKVFANADNDLSYDEYKGKYDGALVECAFGKSWSFYERLGWARMMAEYRAQLANTISKKDAILQGCAAALDLTKLRFGLASAMLEDGWFSYKVTNEAAPTWADEYGANIGTPSEAPPTGPSASGVWMRKYSNGIVLVNPGPTAASVEVGSGYKRLQGTQDPVTNNGLSANIVILESNSGLLLTKE